MSNYSIIDKVVTITGDLTSDEAVLIGSLAAAGYEVKTADAKKPRKKRRNSKPNPLKGKTAKYFEANLTAAQFEEFKNIKERKGFTAAARWGLEQLETSE